MRRLFGMAKEEPPPAAPEKPASEKLTEAADKMQTKIEGLEEKIQKCDEEIKGLIAKGGDANKKRAMATLKRKKMYEQNRDTMLGTMANNEQMAFNLEQAEITAMSVGAMQAGQQALAKQQEAIGIEAVEKLVDDMADLNDNMKDINAALSAPMGGEVEDEDELNDEFARLQEEMTLEAMQIKADPVATPAASSGVAAPVATPAVAAPAAKTAADEEAELMAMLQS